MTPIYLATQHLETKLDWYEYDYSMYGVLSTKKDDSEKVSVVDSALDEMPADDKASIEVLKAHSKRQREI